MQTPPSCTHPDLSPFNFFLGPPPNDPNTARTKPSSAKKRCGFFACGEVLERVAGFYCHGNRSVVFKRKLDYQWSKRFPEIPSPNSSFVLNVTPDYLCILYPPTHCGSVCIYGFCRRSGKSYQSNIKKYLLLRLKMSPLSGWFSIGFIELYWTILLDSIVCAFYTLLLKLLTY